MMLASEERILGALRDMWMELERSYSVSPEVGGGYGHGSSGIVSLDGTRLLSSLPGSSGGDGSGGASSGYLCMWCPRPWIKDRRFSEMGFALLRYLLFDSVH